jgi:alpha-beta hydrolase superfamily lysophospholipase
VIGWSTGGLAAYYAAAHGLADRVVLIAPGIVAKNVFVITEKSLTSDRYAAKEEDPHLDPISPHSPLLVPHFACDLLRTGYAARGLVLGRPCLSPLPVTTPAKAGAWKLPDAFPGFVALSDPNDKYVDAAKTLPVLSANTKFEVESYAGALHEIGNERAGIREKFFADVLAFLARTDR